MLVLIHYFINLTNHLNMKDNIIIHNKDILHKYNLLIFYIMHIYYYFLIKICIFNLLTLVFIYQLKNLLKIMF